MASTEAPLFSNAFSGQEVLLERGGQRLLSLFSFSLSPGQLIHIQGENGAGKSSLLRMFAGLLPVREGHFFWGTQICDLLSPFHRSQVSYVSPIPFLGESQRLKANAPWLTFWGLDQRLFFRPVSELSQGQRMRIHLACALNPDRPLWLLDEPMNGLDFQGQRQLNHALSTHRLKGGIVVMASHVLPPSLEPDITVELK